MPLRIFRRDGDTAPPGGLLLNRRARGCRFDALTEEWRISAEMRVDGGLTETLNRRDPIPIADVLWGPVDGSAPLAPAPSIKTVDPYDIIVAMAGADCPALLSEAELEAYAIQRIAYNVVLDAAPFRISGTVHLVPGTGPATLLDRGAELFVPVTRPVIYLGEAHLRNAAADAVLVNRSYLKDVKRDRRHPGARPPR